MLCASKLDFVLITKFCKSICKDDLLTEPCNLHDLYSCIDSINVLMHSWTFHIFWDTGFYHLSDTIYQIKFNFKLYQNIVKFRCSLAYLDSSWKNMFKQEQKTAQMILGKHCQVSNLWKHWAIPDKKWPPPIDRGVTSDQLFVILVEIFVVPLSKWENALCSVWFCHFTPGHDFWSLPIFAYYSALQHVVQGSLWIFGSIKNLFGSLNFLEPFPKVQ